MKVKIDKTLAASIALHVLVLGWGLVSFSSKAFEMAPEESVAVDVVSADQLAHVMAGMKAGKKENPKPLVEKVAEAKPMDDAVGKITEKKAIVTRSPANMLAQRRMVSESTRARWLTISMGNIRIDNGTRMNRDMVGSDGPRKCAA